MCPNSIFVPYMEVLNIQNWDQNKGDKQTKFFRQAVSLSGELVPLDYFLQTICRFIDEFVPLEYFSQAICHHKNGTCSLELFPQTNCLIPLTGFSNEYCWFSGLEKLIDSSFSGWYFFYGQCFPLQVVFCFMVFPYVIYWKELHLLHIFGHLSLCIAIVKLLQVLR